jgi:F-type H+-transporting ATPase subunit a
MAHDPKDHVMDSDRIEFFTSLFDREVAWHLPNIFGFQITKFMVLELIAAGLILAIFIPLARRARTGALPKGAWWNAFESLLTFVRNEIAKPNLDPPADAHHHDEHGHDHHGHDHHGHDHKKEHSTRSPADLYVPYLWTVFLFVLFCNLLGMIPFPARRPGTST